MDILYLNRDPVINAREHCHIHVSTMIVVYTRLLSMAHRKLDSDHMFWHDGLGFYEALDPKDYNHPSVKWVVYNNRHYQWLYQCLDALHTVYELTHNMKEHGSKRLMKHLNLSPSSILQCEFHPPYIDHLEEEHAKVVEFHRSGEIDVQTVYHIILNERFKQWRDKPRQLIPTWFHGKPDWVD